MCQAFEGESRGLKRQELREIHIAWEKHESGEKPLSDQELHKLAIRKLMLEEV